jgi:hypothetical protein
MANKRYDQLTALSGTVSLLDLVTLWDTSTNTTVQTTVQKLADAVPTQQHTHVKADVTDFAHTHPKSEITDFAHTHPKADITDFAHTHPKSEITDFAHTHVKSDVTDFSHTHPKSEITDFAHTHVKSDVTDFAHTHVKADVTDFAHTHVKADVTDFAHTHVKSDVTDFDHGHVKADIVDFAHSHSDATASASGFMSYTDKNKLDGIAAGATANATDGFLLNRANHTGTQLASTISDFTEATQDAVASALTDTSTIDFTYNDTSNTIAADVLDASISNAKLRLSSATTVIGRSANTAGAPADIAATADGQVLRRSGGTLGFGVLNIDDLNDVVITSPTSNQVIKYNGTNWVNGSDDGGSGSGDNISVNGTAAIDADFDDTTPAAPANARNVKWQKDTNSPNNISAYINKTDWNALTPLTTKGDLVISDGTDPIRVAVGSNNQLLVADSAQSSGVRWTDAPSVLTRANTLQTVVNTTTETSVFSFSVPGNTLGTTRMMRLTLLGDILNNSGATVTFTPRIKFGATTLYADAISLSTSGNRRGFCATIYLSAQNATNVQTLGGHLTLSGNGTTTTGIGDFGASSTGDTAISGSAAIDSTAAQTFTVTIQFGTANANTDFRRQYAILELL